MDSSGPLPGDGGRLYNISRINSSAKMIPVSAFVCNGIHCPVDSGRMMRIQKKHHLGKEEARKRVADVADELCNQYGLTSSWAGDDLKFTGTGVNGCIAVSEQRVDVEVKLGFALLMMSGTIRSSIEGALTSHLLE